MKMHIQSRLVEGDPLSPSDGDLIAQWANLSLNEMPKDCDGQGWRIMTGGATFNVWARLAYRYET